jgi:hypothetical protein
MPRLGDLNVDLEKQKLPTGNYSFSATRISDLGATEYTLATIVVDWSGSTEGFRGEMEKCLKSVVQSCKFSPRSDNLMVRVLIFAKDLKEIHGFKLLAKLRDSICNVIGGFCTRFYNFNFNIRRFGRFTGLDFNVNVRRFCFFSHFLDPYHT